MEHPRNTSQVITHQDASYIVSSAWTMPDEQQPWKTHKKVHLLLKSSVEKQKVLGFIVYGKFREECEGNV